MEENEDKGIALVTGGTKGIGFATARKLAEAGYRVVLTGRSRPACDEAARAVEAAAPGARASGMALDLASASSIRAFAEALLARDANAASDRPLRLLVHNAGQMTLDKERRVTADGLETTLATNAFGPFLLTSLLLDALRRAAPSRIVFVGSRVHLPGSGMGGEVRWDWDDVQGERAFDPVVFYKNSKLAVMWMTYELARRLDGAGVTVNAVCPGFVPETVAEHAHGVRRFFYKHVMPHVPGAHSVDEAAANTVFAATDDRYAAKSGAFIGEKTEVAASEQAGDAEQARRFWDLASRLMGVDSRG